MSDEIQHKRYSPSQAERIFRCPGSVALLDRSPLRRDGEYSAEGTMAHDILAAGLMNGVNRFTAAKALSPHAKKHFNGEFMQAVNDAFSYISETFKELNDEFGDAVLYVEEFVNPPVSEAPGEAGGYVDVAIHSAIGKKLYVIDYKHGVGVPVDVEDNKQLKQYGAGFVYDEDSKIKREDIEDITLVIIQPRSFHKDGDVRELDIDKHELLEYIFELDEAILASKDENAVLNPGEKQCQFCDAKTICPALRSQALTAVNPTFTEMNKVTEKELPDFTDMPPEKIAYALRMMPMLRTWMNGLEDYAKELLIHGQEVPGYKMVKVKPKRSWNGDPEDIAPQLASLIGCDPEELFTKKFINITDAEKKVKRAFRKRVAKKKKNLASEDAGKQFAYFTTKDSSGNLTLVTEDDSRPAVNKSESVFGNVGHKIQPPSKGETT